MRRSETILSWIRRVVPWPLTVEADEGEGAEVRHAEGACRAGRVVAVVAAEWAPAGRVGRNVDLDIEVGGHGGVAGSVAVADGCRAVRLNDDAVGALECDC